MDLRLPLWILMTTASMIDSGDAVLSDLEHRLLMNASSGPQHAHLPSWLKEEESSPSEHAHFLRPPPTGFVPNQDSFLAKYHLRNPDLEDLESHQKRLASLYHPLGGKLDPRPPQDHQPLQSVPELDVVQLLQKKHDYQGGGGNQFGGWDNFPSPGFDPAAIQAALAVKKQGKEAKALFVLMAPLILLAVFGPFLATQAMIPWFTGAAGGVSTIAGAGRRRRRSAAAFQQAELEQRLRLFLEVQDFLAGAGSPEYAQGLGRAFLQCQSPQAGQCLERLACECADGKSALSAAERRIGKMVLKNILYNAMVSASMKERIRKGLMSGKNVREQCKRYWCRTIDQAQEK